MAHSQPARPKPAKLTRQEKLIGLGASALLVLCLILLFALIPASPKSANLSATNTSSKQPQPTKPTQTISAAKPQIPTVSLATLNAQIATSLTAETNNLINLYKKVKSDASMSDAAAANSAFYHDKHTFDTDPHMSTYNTYKNSSDAYYTAKLSQPASLDNWDTDAEQLYTDINNWTQNTYAVLTDQLFSNPTQTDQASVNAAAQAYNNDLAKTQADIKAL